MNGIKSEEEPALTDMSLKCYTGPLRHLRQASRILPGCGWSHRKNLPSQCFSVFLGHTGALQTGRDSGRISPVFLKPVA